MLSFVRRFFVANVKFFLWTFILIPKYFKKHYAWQTGFLAARDCLLLDCCKISLSIKRFCRVQTYQFVEFVSRPWPNSAKQIKYFACLFVEWVLFESTWNWQYFARSSKFLFFQLKDIFKFQMSLRSEIVAVILISVWRFAYFLAYFPRFLMKQWPSVHLVGLILVLLWGRYVSSY